MINYNTITENISIPKEELNVNIIIPEPNNDPIWFVDGGNTEIISSPEFSIQIIKTVAIKIKDKKTSEIISNQDYFIIKKIEQGYKIIKLENQDKNNSEFTIITNKDITETGNLLRNILELKLCNHIQEISTDIIVKDGSLQITHDLEKDEILKFKNVCGLCKTSKELKEEISLISRLNKIKDTWYFENNKKSYIVKLNKNSKYSFKLETNGLEITKLINQLISNSYDYSFPGYPYGLIIVDQLARVSKQQVASLKTLFELKLGKNWNQIENLENTINAHQVLDKLSF